MVFRPSTKFLVETKADIEKGTIFNRGFMKEFNSYKFMNDFQNMGYFICSGEIQKEDDLKIGNELRIRESYYYFTQIFNEGDMQDPGELVNHPWMLMLRGQRDFAVFEQALMAPIPMTWGEARDQRNNDLADTVSRLTGANPDSTNNRFVSPAAVNGTPLFNAPGDFEVVTENDISRALDMMQYGFERALPAVPGMYTFSDFDADGVTAWPHPNKQITTKVSRDRQ